MTRKLDNPIVPVVAPIIIEQNIPLIRIDFGFRPKTAPDEGAEINLSITSITYVVGNFVSAGHAVTTKDKTVFHTDWPVEVVNAVRALAKWADEDGETAGLIDPGESSDDL